MVVAEVVGLWTVFFLTILSGCTGFKRGMTGLSIGGARWSAFRGLPGSPPDEAEARDAGVNELRLERLTPDTR